MIPIHHHPRKVGILAAREYLLSRKPEQHTLQEIERIGTRKGQMPWLRGINIPAKQELKNVLGKPLPTISL